MAERFMWGEPARPRIARHSVAIVAAALATGCRPPSERLQADRPLLLDLFILVPRRYKSSEVQAG